MAFGKGICRGCGRPIIWIRTTGKKSMPCDPDPVVFWPTPGGKQKVVTPSGEVFSAELDGTPDEDRRVGYISHFATCPNSSEFRKR